MSFTQAQIVAAAKVLHDEDSLMDPKPHSYERLSLPVRIAYEDVAIRVLGAALRAAGGQAEPSGDKAMRLLDEVERIVKFEAGANDVYMRADVLSVIRQVRAAAAVSGEQAQPDGEPR